jgi:hypothetical protein
VGAETGQDIKDMPCHSIEIKARANFDPLAWLRQAKRNAKAGETPCAIIRLNGQGETPGEYLVIRRLEDDVLALGPQVVSAEFMNKLEASGGASD